MDFDLLFWGSLRFPKTNFMNRCLIWLGLSQETGLPKKTRTPHVFHHFFLEIVHQCTMEHRGIIIVRYYIYMYTLYSPFHLYIYVTSTTFFRQYQQWASCNRAGCWLGLLEYSQAWSERSNDPKAFFFFCGFCRKFSNKIRD